jgi:hypothetical protein
VSLSITSATSFRRYVAAAGTGETANGQTGIGGTLHPPPCRDHGDRAAGKVLGLARSLGRKTAEVG